MKQPYKFPKFLFAIVWLTMFPLAMWYIKKTEGLSTERLLNNIVGFLNVIGWSLAIIKILTN